MEIRDPLTLELLSTLELLKPTEPTPRPGDIFIDFPDGRSLGYSPDGHSLACASGTAITIWDVQTGGVTAEVERDDALDCSLAWSLDGRTIGVMPGVWDIYTWIVVRYDAASGAALSSVTLRSEDKPHLWAHNESFRAMTTARDGGGRTIDILEVGSVVTKVESFPIRSGFLIRSFSPTTHRISAPIYGNANRFLILDIRNSEHLLTEMGNFEFHCFSPDGCLFAASSVDRVHVWKYAACRYTPWREFPVQGPLCSPPRFSPASSSILVRCKRFLRVWRLDGPPTTPAARDPRFALSRSGTYITTAGDRNRTVTVTNLLSPTRPQIIDTDVEILTLGLTDNVLLVLGSGMVVAWLLTEEGLVDGVCGNGRAARNDSIWAVSAPRHHSWDPVFSVKGDIGLIKSGGNIFHAYNTVTGEVLDPARTPLHLNNPWYSLVAMMQTRNHLYDGSVHDGPPGDGWKLSQDTLKRGWMKDREGRHLLWLPVGWRTFWDADWLHDITTLQLRLPDQQFVIIKF